MLVPTRASPFQRVLVWFLVSVGAVLLMIFVTAFVTQASESAISQAVIAAFIFLGLAWVVLGWLFTPSVQTCVSPGAIRGIPILSPGSAIPERSQPVLEDLASKLSGQTDMGITCAALGFLLMSVGVLFYAFPSVGLAVILAFLASVAVLLLYSFRMPPARIAR